MSFLFVAAEALEPQVPGACPRPPRERWFTLMFVPMPTFAIADPVGAMLRVPFANVLLVGMVEDFAPEPLKVRLL